MLSFVLEKAAQGKLISDIHVYKFEELYVMLDVNSGSIHVVDEIAWSIVEAAKASRGQEDVFWRLLRPYPEEQINDVLGELHHLVDEGLWFAEDTVGTSEPVRALDNVIKSLCLHVSHDCNLSCRYCFAGTGSFGGSRKHMSLEVGKKALDFLLDNSGLRPTCEVDFFGGEPLLNWPVVKELVNYGKKEASKRGKTIKFTLTTNGLLLSPDKEDFLNGENISVVLSLDGRREAHDQMRPLASGSGSFDLVAPRIKSLVSSRQGNNYYIRGTFTRFNLDFARDVLFLADEGFTEISLEPVVASPQEDYSFKTEDMPRLAEEYRVLAREYLQRRKLGRAFNFFHFNVELEKGPCLAKRITGCGAGYQYLAVTPDGDLYPCHQFVGNHDYLLGDLQKGIIKHSLVDGFKRAHIYNKQCKECWARYHCSGGCHANAVNHNGDIGIPYEMGCFLQKVRIEAAIYLFIKERGRLVLDNQDSAC
ncbi:MAG: thioether cross-link-forming SCIFF peptide maturase [Bacillota bacterium]